MQFVFTVTDSKLVKERRHQWRRSTQLSQFLNFSDRISNDVWTAFFEVRGILWGTLKKFVVITASRTDAALSFILGIQTLSCFALLKSHLNNNQRPQCVSMPAYVIPRSFSFVLWSEFSMVRVEPSGLWNMKNRKLIDRKRKSGVRPVAGPVDSPIIHHHWSRFPHTPTSQRPIPLTFSWILSLTVRVWYFLFWMCVWVFSAHMLTHPTQYNSRMMTLVTWPTVC